MLASKYYCTDWNWMFHQWLFYIFLQLCCKNCPLWQVYEYLIVFEARFAFV
jgi:hypothetical protein